jgi:hypothetical protein
MAERGEPGERQPEHVAAAAAAGIRDEPNAAGVVLEAGVVETGGRSVGQDWAPSWLGWTVGRPAGSAEPAGLS